MTKHDGAILYDIWHGGKAAATPANTIAWLNAWADAVEQAVGYEAPGVGTTHCRGATTTSTDQAACVESAGDKARVSCQVGDESTMDISISWKGRHYQNFYVDPSESGGWWMKGNPDSCPAGGASKGYSYEPWQVIPGTYEIWVQGSGLLFENGLECKPGPYKVTVKVDGVEVWSVDDAVKSHQDKYYYVTIE